MEIIIASESSEVGRIAGGVIASVVERVGAEAVLGVATGSSPEATYAELAARVEAGTLDLSRASAFALDEYVGLPAGHVQSYRTVIERVATGLGMDLSRVHVPDGTNADPDAAAVAYEQQIADAGGVDVQLLGIGANGHIGFNEPTSSLSSRTRIKTLATQTRIDNQRFFSSIDEVPVHCLTQGLGTILDARSVVLVASGEHKADAVAHMVEGPLSAMWPASVLQLHRHATIVVDEAAASQLTLGAYYRQTYEQKP